MKRVILLVAFATTFSAFAADTEVINLVFIGNSITAGATLQNSKEQAPPIKVGKILSEKTGKKVNVTNCGASGSTTFDWLPGKGNYKRAFDAAAKYQQQGGTLVFCISLGTNDSAQDRCNGSPVSPNTYAQNLRTIIINLLISYPLATYVVNYPIWYSPNTHNSATYEKEGLERLTTYHPIITNLVATMHQEQFPVYAGNPEVFSFFSNKNNLFTAEKGKSGIFYLHPNLEGGTHLATFWTTSILQALEH